MRARTHRFLGTSMALLLGMAALFAPAAVLAEDERAQPTDRDSRIALGLTARQLEKMLPSEGKSPKTVKKLQGLSGYGTGDAGGGSGSFETDSFSRFLHIGLQQSYGKTYEEGWKILHSVVQRALSDLGPLPLGLRMALESGRDASYDRSWQDAYKILHEAAKTASNNTGDFTSSQPATFAAYMHLARQSSYEKSYEVAWKVLEKYLDNLEKRGQALIPSRELGLLVRAARQASYSKSWKAAWEIQHAAIKRAENLPSGELRGFYYATALECSYDKTYQEGYEVLRTFIDQALSSGLVSNFDRASLQTTLQASYNQSWQTGYNVLRDGLKALLP
ncbi:MAG: hypothetical protein HY816_01885 [Candidatus Wallbacteria bacterium]|nr:hypothetical protein [Candidatus Wallbacteria bacterium]